MHRNFGLSPENPSHNLKISATSAEDMIDFMTVKLLLNHVDLKKTI